MHSPTFMFSHMDPALPDCVTEGGRIEAIVYGMSNLLLESQDLDSNVNDTVPACVGNEVGPACRRSALTRSAGNYYHLGKRFMWRQTMPNKTMHWDRWGQLLL